MHEKGPLELRTLSVAVRLLARLSVASGREPVLLADFTIGGNMKTEEEIAAVHTAVLLPVNSVGLQVTASASEWAMGWPGALYVCAAAMGVLAVAVLIWRLLRRHAGPPSRREHMIQMLLVDDDLGRSRVARDYAGERGDMALKVAACTWDVADQVVDREWNSIELFLLDVRVPIGPRERDRNPAELPPRGVALARALRRNPPTSLTPVVVYTKFGLDPEVANELADLEDRVKYPNVVRIFRVATDIPEVLHAGLTAIRNLDVNIRPRERHPTDFEVILSSHVTYEDLEQTGSRILLNGMGPTVVSREPDRSALFVRFPPGARYEFHKNLLGMHDYNYLMVQTADGRKSIFAV